VDNVNVVFSVGDTHADAHALQLGDRVLRRHGHGNSRLDAIADTDNRSDAVGHGLGCSFSHGLLHCRRLAVDDSEPESAAVSVAERVLVLAADLHIHGDDDAKRIIHIIGDVIAGRSVVAFAFPSVCFCGSDLLPVAHGGAKRVAIARRVADDLCDEAGVGIADAHRIAVKDGITDAVGVCFSDGVHAIANDHSDGRRHGRRDNHACCVDLAELHACPHTFPDADGGGDRVSDNVCGSHTVDHGLASGDAVQVCYA